jgi:hypothetical protein
MLLDSDRPITPNATRRLKAIEEFTELGAGFKIAMRDLEIRGAGNILGTQQSGHIAAVGYELYCHLLENAVRSLKNMPVKTHMDVTIDLPWVAMLPRDYVPGQKLKIEVYRRLSRIRKLDRLEDFRQELRDRFGPLPTPAVWLMRLAELRILASFWQIAEIHLEGKWTVEEGDTETRRHKDNEAGRQVDTQEMGADGDSLAPCLPVSLSTSDSGTLTAIGPVDLVLTYRHPRKMDRLAKRAAPRLRIVDAQSAYFRLSPEEYEPLALYASVKHLLRLSERTI